MAGDFWELFVGRVTANPHPRIPDELNRLAEQIAGFLVGFDAPTAADLLSAFNDRVARQYEGMQRTAGDTTVNGTAGGATVSTGRPTDPSDAARPALRDPFPAPPELLATIRQAVNDEEAAREIREIRSGGGRTLDQFVGELEALAQQPSDPTGAAS